MYPVRFFVGITLCALFLVPLRAAPAEAVAPSAQIQAGKTAQVRLLKVARLPAREAADGMGFLFLVTPATNASGGFAVKETRDMQLAGSSYQEKTEVELGRRFEPGTQIMGADKFFADNPRLKPSDLAEPPKGAVVISLMLRGTKLAPDSTAKLTLQVGYDKQVEDFTFNVPVPRG